MSRKKLILPKDFKNATGETFDPSTVDPKLADPDFAGQLAGYSLVTYEILYRMPDTPSLLQSFVGQKYDIAPRFPVIIAFANWWNENLDSPIHSLHVEATQLIKPAELKIRDAEFALN